MKLKNVQSGEILELDGQIPHGAVYVVEGYDEETEEFWNEERTHFRDEEWIVIDDGVEMVSLGPTDWGTWDCENCGASIPGERAEPPLGHVHGCVGANGEDLVFTRKD